MRNCIFCEVPADELLAVNAHAFIRWDKFPVSPGHILVIPKRHFASAFEATAQEHQACWKMINQAKRLVEAEYTPDGYNIGINVGRAGGQSVFHMHIHIIPRYTGDVPEPLGGVRGVLPFKRKYSAV
jgi:diadenosine tetraphosphate (Ap4A) HIT family hydrolase